MASAAAVFGFLPPGGAAALLAARARGIEADEMGCHIITAPADILKKLPAIGTKTGADLSLDAVNSFRADAMAAGLTLKLAPHADAAE
jgi:transaldolase